MAVAVAQMAYSHPKSKNHNSTPQYMIACQNNVSVRAGMRTKMPPIHEQSLGYGRDFASANSVAPQTNSPKFRNIGTSLSNGE